MLDQIKLFFEKHIALPPTTSAEEQLQLASIALFMEMMVMDDVCKEQERAQIVSLVQKSFSVTAEQAETLLTAAEQRRKQATDYYEFTSLIDKQCSLEQKIQFVESLWRIAFADGELHPQEEYLVRKIAGLLHVPHINFIMAKHKVNPGA
jgi:uncharacterized tellurite resistance protein B-like protein